MVEKIEIYMIHKSYKKTDFRFVNNSQNYYSWHFFREKKENFLTRCMEDFKKEKKLKKSIVRTFIEIYGNDIYHYLNVTTYFLYNFYELKTNIVFL